jgi:hypothetical protein
MQFLLKNVFFKKNFEFDDCINILYWILLMSKNVFKWYITWTVINNFKGMLITLLFIVPVIKFLIIGRVNLLFFRGKVKNDGAFFVMLLIIVFECFFELPSHFLFPRNIIYLHTIYHKIYDEAKYRKLESRIEIIENIILDVYLIHNLFISNEPFNFLALTLFILCNIFLVFFTYAYTYFFFFMVEGNIVEDDKDKDFYGLPKIGTNQERIPYEIRTVQRDFAEKVNTSEERIIGDESARYNLVSQNK